MVDISARTVRRTTWHVRAGEFGTLPDDLLNGVEEVTFGSNLAPRTNGKHASLHVNGKAMLGLVTIVYIPQSPPTAIQHRWYSDIDAQ
jgi:hypothetical protein